MTLLHIFLFSVEFPAVLLDIQTGEILDEFQQYVLPRDNPKLSEFCKNLTGISQASIICTYWTFLFHSASDYD